MAHSSLCKLIILIPSPSSQQQVPEEAFLSPAEAMIVLE